MMPAHPPLFKLSILAALVGAVCAPASGTTTEDAKPIEKIMVTGSHIRRTAESSNPVDQIEMEAMAREGVSRIVDAVKFIPANTGSFLTQEAGAMTGTAQFNIRGLGAGSTLTLINGKRGGKSPMADGNGNQFFDLNQLPMAMVGRIEVQKDGASATYGSDAVGGVVNIITRKGFAGLELSAKAETASNDAYSLGLVSGKVFDQGSINFYAGYYQQSRNIRSDFDFINQRINGDGNPLNSVLTSGTGGPGSYQQALVDEQGSYLQTIGNIPKLLGNAFFSGS
jgi:outer membrane receptor for ferrienterochelin and colicin